MLRQDLSGFIFWKDCWTNDRFGGYGSVIMKIHVLTLFPEMIEAGLAPSIIGRAVEKGLISLETVNIRDYTQERHGRVDDYTYGGGAGMLLQAQPVYDAWKAVTAGKSVRTVYVTPQGTPFTQKMAGELSREEELVFLCGHYEGIDERVLEETVTDYVSIGDYVLTGGELPAMVMIDAVARLIPGVLGNETSAEEESFFNDLLEYPQYSRPEEWHGKRVPGILLSGNHAGIMKWRRERAEERTEKYRPDLYLKYTKKQRLIKRLSKNKRNHIHIMEALSRGNGELLYQEDGSLLVRAADRICMLLAEEPEEAAALCGRLTEDAEWVVVTQEALRDALEQKGYTLRESCSQYVYTARETLPVRYKEIRNLTTEDLPYVTAHYQEEDGTYLRERIREGMLYGAFSGPRLIGFAGFHSAGSMGMLYVEESFRRQGIAASLEAYGVNRCLERGWTAYGQVPEGNRASEELQEKLGFYKASGKIFWMKKTLAN